MLQKRSVSLAERSKARDSSSRGAIRVGSNPTADILFELNLDTSAMIFYEITDILPKYLGLYSRQPV